MVVSAGATAPDGALRALAAALSAFSLDTAGAGVAVAARQRIFDTLGAARLGLETAEGRQMRAVDAELRALGAARHALDRCRLLVGAARSTEIDDIDVASCTTVGSVVVPAALALAAAEPRPDGRALLAGVIAGYEAMVRLGRAIGGATLLYRGVWPTYVTAAFGSAAAAARLLGLDAEQTALALAVALARTGVPPRGALARPGFRSFALGAAAVEGCVAALAARAGVGGDASDLAGFGERIGARLDDNELVEGLGSGWRVRSVDTKMFPSSRQALASVEAFLAFGPLPRPIDELERIVVAVPGAYREMIDRPVPPAQRIESLLGVQYQIALAALEPAALYDALRVKLRRDEPMAALMARVEVRADAELGARFPRVWGSSVTLHWRAGEETRSEVLEPSGSGRRELGWAALRGKHERIFAASGLDRPGFLGSLQARCESVGEGDAMSPSVAASLLESLEFDSLEASADDGAGARSAGRVLESSS
jgi:2-methylcitrate dehydratase PrpD